MKLKNGCFLRAGVMAASALIAIIVAAPACAQSVDFDQGIDASEILRQSKEAAKKDTTIVKAQYWQGGRSQSDCVTISFGANDSPVSPMYDLRSWEQRGECYRVNDPLYGGYTDCVSHRHERVSITIRDRRALLPWERDTFRVCLEGSWLSFIEVETAYDYHRVSGGSFNGAYVLAPVRKVAQRPDPVGVVGELDSALMFTLQDRWASYYSGERIEIRYALKKHVRNWFDAVVMEGTLDLAVADSYAVDLSKAGGFDDDARYYVEYEIRRVGKISRSSFTKTLTTAKVRRASAPPTAAP